MKFCVTQLMFTFTTKFKITFLNLLQNLLHKLHKKIFIRNQILRNNEWEYSCCIFLLVLTKFI